MELNLLNLKGGFGNQLFQLSFANYLKNTKNKVIINTDIYKVEKDLNNTRRELVVNLEDFKFRESSNFEKLIFNNLNTIFNSSIVMKLFPKNNNFIFKTVKDKDLNKYGLKNSIFTIYDGYWQEYNYIDYSKKFLISSLSKNKLIFDATQSPKISGSTLIHVRRQDYLKLKQELDIGYYKKAINKASELVEDFNFTVFTDDIDWVNTQDVFKDAIKIYLPKSDETKKDVIETFSEMLKFENFIIANSSFSYMAAFLGSTTNSKVFYPNPWFKGRRKEISFDKKWFNIDQ